MNEKEPLGVPAGGGGSDGHGPGAFASPPSGPAGEGAPGKQAERRPDGNPGPEQNLDRHVSRETSPHPPNGKRSSFYVYLAVLFGAAFLMLLLAYFVQRRNNETAISALRSTMDLSREELMEEIQGLEEEKAALEEQTDQLQEERDDLEKQLDELRNQHAQLTDDFSDQYKKVEGWLNFWALEERFLSRDYEACARFLQTLANSGSLNLPDSDSALARMREIRDTLVDRGYLAEDDPAEWLFGAPKSAEPKQQG